MTRRVLLLFVAAALLSAQTSNLDIYWIDVEGGGSTLIVTPEGQSLLVDTGNATPDDRDAKRMLAAAKAAGLSKIDFVLTTHFHGDHVGAAPALAKMIPIGQYLDHGDSIEADSPRSGPAWRAYADVAKGKRTTLKVGDRLPLRGVESVVVSSNGEVLKNPVNGGAPNPFCQGAAQRDPDTTENQRSLGFLLTYGSFKFLDLGDLTWDKEMELACPANKLGAVTLFQATHHGFVRDFSGAPAHVLALKPQVVVVNNGPRKGWQPSAWETTQRIEGLEGVWQVHRALDSGPAQNTTPDMIANMEETEDCNGHRIKASVASDGTFTLTNGRNNFSKTYRSR
jgi:beta-lactamase superfamily II metal-dependent hydrolase